MAGLLKLIMILLVQVNQGQAQVPATPEPEQSQAQVANQSLSHPQPAGPSQVTPAVLGAEPTLSAVADTIKIDRPMPKLVLDKTTYDFGQIKPGSANTASFHLTNTGDGTLQITDARKCCGAVIKLDKQKLEPGENTVLTAEYRAGQVAGLMTKKIGLMTNDPNHPLVELTITGKVVQTLVWTPTHLDLRAGKQTIPCPDITIKSLDGMPFSIKGWVATGQCLTTEFDPNSKAMEFVLKPKVDTGKLEALITSTGTIRIDLDHPDYKTIDLGFTVIPSLQAIPSQILVFGSKEDESVVRSIQVQDNEADPNHEGTVRIESVTSTKGSRVEVRSTTETKKGCDLKLEIWPKHEQTSESFWTDQLVLKLKDGRQVDVPVRFFYRSTALSTTATSISNL